MKKFSLDKEFKPFYEISNQHLGRRLVITDIHGFYDTFIELLNKVGFAKDDQLFLLGDFIDRGDKVKELLDRIIELIKDGYSIFPLRGNHEEMAWQAHLKQYDEEALKLPSYKWGKAIIDRKRNILPEYTEFISKLPYYYILDRFYLVHAGFNFSNPEPFEDYNSMVWINYTEANSTILNGKSVIHGHSTRPLDEIKAAVRNKQQVIGLDNALSNITNPDYGNLLCLNLDTYELIIQPNID